MSVISSPVVAGNPALASQYNDLRKDATGLTNIVVSATAVVAGDVLFNDSAGSGFRKAYNEIPPFFKEFRIAASSSAGSGASGTAYKAGAYISGIFSGLTPGADYYCNSGVLSTTPDILRIRLGTAESATVFHFNPHYEDITTINVTSVGAIGTKAFVFPRTSDGKWDYYIRANFGTSIPRIIGISASSIGSSGTISILLPGQIVGGFSGLTAGSHYYIETNSSTAALTSTRHPNSLYVGQAISTTELNFQRGSDPRLSDEPGVATGTAGANWTGGNFLYLASDGMIYPAISTGTAEQGLAEFPLIGVATHTGGSGSAQPVYLPGTVLNLYSGMTAGNRFYTGTVSGSSTAVAPASLDGFYRVYARAMTTGQLLFQPGNIEFLPTGVQEKGYCGAETRSSNSPNAATIMGVGVNFRRVMSTIPSSITLTAVTNSGLTSGPIAGEISRFGFFIDFNNSGVGLYRWSGYYTTVGN